jgi:hypothetical protein
MGRDVPWSICLTHRVVSWSLRKHACTAHEGKCPYNTTSEWDSPRYYACSGRGLSGTCVKRGIRTLRIYIGMAFGRLEGEPLRRVRAETAKPRHAKPLRAHPYNTKWKVSQTFHNLGRKIQTLRMRIASPIISNKSS